MPWPIGHLRAVTSFDPTPLLAQMHVDLNSLYMLHIEAPQTLPATSLPISPHCNSHQFHHIATRHITANFTTSQLTSNMLTCLPLPRKVLGTLREDVQQGGVAKVVHRHHTVRSLGSEFPEEGEGEMVRENRHNNMLQGSMKTHQSIQSQRESGAYMPT